MRANWLWEFLFGRERRGDPSTLPLEIEKAKTELDEAIERSRHVRHQTTQITNAIDGIIERLERQRERD